MTQADECWNRVVHHKDYLGEKWKNGREWGDARISITRGQEEKTGCVSSLWCWKEEATQKSCCVLLARCQTQLRGQG
jgi:hypothetical protein